MVRPALELVTDQMTLLCCAVTGVIGHHINLGAFQWPVLCSRPANNRPNGRIQWMLFPYFRDMETEAQEIKGSVCRDVGTTAQSVPRPEVPLL